MIKVPTHKSLVALPRVEENEVAYVEKENRYFKYVNKVWEPVEPEGTLSLGSVYDMNKQIISQMPDLKNEKIDEAIETVKKYAEENDGKFFMLLCNELKYYTVFVKDNGEYEMPGEVIICAAELGKLKSVSIDENGAVELWVQPEGDEPHVMYFFNYDKGVIVCQ